MKKLILFLLLTSISFANKFDDIKIIFINGIQNTREQTRVSADELSVASIGYIGKMT